MSSATSPSPADHQAIRASTTEREHTVAALHAALGEGRLDLAETELRVATAYAARYRHELPPLVTDLPGAGSTERPRAGEPAPSWTRLWHDVVWRARVTVWRDDASLPPTAAQLRHAALLAGLALVWVVLCALVGAAMVLA